MAAIEASLPVGFKPINIRGTKLAYKEIGTGPPLILVHANVSDFRSWNAVEPYLAKQFKVITYCRRYHWPLQGIPDGEPDPWEEQAEDLAELIKVLDVAPVTLMGNSSGSTLTLLVAKNYPERVQALILEEPPTITLFLPRTPPSLLDVVKLLVWHPVYFPSLVYFGATVIGPTEKHFKQNEIDAALRVFLRGVLGDEVFNAMTEERWKQVKDNAKPHQAIFCYGSFLPSFTEEDAKAIKAPTLVLESEKAVPAHSCINAQLTVLIPGATKVLVKNAGHLMHEDEPQQVSEKIFEWFVFS